MRSVLCTIDIDANQPFDAEQERAYCHAHWPHQSRYMIVTGGLSRALLWHNGHLTRKGGEAFPIATSASLAQLGLWLVQEMLQAVEGITPLTPLSRRVFAQFDQHIDRVIDWSKHADASAYATLGNAVLADRQDPLAIRLLTDCARELDMMINARPPACGDQVYLSGELAQACFPYLSSGSAS